MGGGSIDGGLFAQARVRSCAPSLQHPLTAAFHTPTLLSVLALKSQLQVLRKRLQILGTTLRARDIAYKADLVRRFSEVALPGLASGALKPVIDSEFPLADIQAAHALMESNATTGKVRGEARNRSSQCWMRRRVACPAPADSPPRHLTIQRVVGHRGCRVATRSACGARFQAMERGGDSRKAL
jgi:hypothetical protein